MKKQTINAQLMGNVVNVFINGKLRRKACDSVDTAKSFYELILKVKENLSQEGITKVLSFLNEKLRVAMDCGLETDVETGEVYLAGFNTPVPMTLVEVAKDYHENGYPVDAIINFWKLLMLNPDTRVRTSLFDFIKTHDFVLTDSGYMIVYKAVYYRAEGTEDTVLAEFISNRYLHVKKDWGTSPKKYVVYQNDDGEFEITKVKTAKKWGEKRGVSIVGNLSELYKNLTTEAVADEDATYTDMYTRSMPIEVGVPVIMDRKECDGNPAQECSYGLHVGATKYVERFGRGTSAILVCYVNPAHVVAVPEYDNSKMRVSEYFPFAVATYDNDKIDIVEQSYFPSDYSHYEKQELERMVEEVQAGEVPIETAITSDDEDRPMSELQKIIENRLIVLS